MDAPAAPGNTEPEADNPPPGFVPLMDCAESERIAGPYYIREDADPPAIGFRVKHRHLNRGGMCHGGFLATLADMNITPISRANKLAGVNPTISMSLDYFAPVLHGQWVEAEPHILRRTRNILFSQCVLTADGEPCVRASVVYRLGRPAPPVGAEDGGREEGGHEEGGHKTQTRATNETPD